MAKKYIIFKAFMAAAVAVLGLAFAGQANAAAPVPKPVLGTEGPKAPTVVITKPSDVPKAQRAIRKSSAAASGHVQITVLSNISAKPMSRRLITRCWWDRDGFWNTAQTAAGGLRNFWDTRPSEICRGKDGKQYRRLCRNPVFSRPVYPVVRGVIVLIDSFGKFKETIKKTATATAKDWCGSASASAEASATVSGRTRMEARGNARLLATVRATLRAAVKASAQVNCGPKAQPPTVPPVPPQKFTTLAFVKEVWNAAGNRTSTTVSFPVTITVPGSTLSIGVPGTGEKVALRDSAGNSFRFGPNAVIRACEDEVVLTNWIVLVARCYEVTTSPSGGEIVFTFRNQAKPPAPPPPVTPQQPPPPTPQPTPTPAPSCPSWTVESPKSDATVANGTASGGSGTFTWSWGDNTSSTGTSVSHKYATPPPGPAGSGVTYIITVSATLGNQTIGCGGRSFFVPAPPPPQVTTTGSTGGSSGGSSGGSGGSQPPLP